MTALIQGDLAGAFARVVLSVVVNNYLAIDQQSATVVRVSEEGILAGGRYFQIGTVGKTVVVVLFGGTQTEVG